MNGGRRNFDPAASLTTSPLEPQAVRPPRTKRLSRSFRLTQAVPAEADSPRSQRSDFKTPTRIPRSKPAAVSSEESPHADSDFQQDIIWDATSPSPRRFSKRGKKPTAGVVNISEIVSRIAPKHGRPQVIEPTLQQWIGDSATIPCTPDVQAPRAKKKSPRPSRVDDLLRLAKQFDFNMFHRNEDEEEEEEEHQNLEILSQDILEETVQKNSSSFPPESCEAAVSAAAGSNLQPDLDQYLEDDLDFLFDGPTQHVSGNLSQPTQVKPLTSTAISTATCKPSHTNEFEDDWENDDLLNDSVVMEMTQNPQNFMAPKLCLTQKPAGLLGPEPVGQPGRGQTAGLVPAAVQVSNQTGPRPGKDAVRLRASFKLQSASDFSERRVQTDTGTIRFPPETRPQQTQQTCRSNTVKPELMRPRLDQSLKNSAVVPSSSSLPAVDFLDEDLDSFFKSDPVWDDLADDDLLCEMCEDLENQIQGVNNSSTRSNPGSTNQRAALLLTHRTSNNRIQTAGSSLGAKVSVVRDPFRFTQTKTASESRCLKTSSQSAAAIPLPQQHAKTHNFTFKKPNNPVSMATNKAVGKCSAAEIEMKKQQAMERRRQRLQAAQNIRAPT